MLRSTRWLLAVVVLALSPLALACGDSEGELIEVALTAEVVDWDVVNGELVEVWGYNGEYPGPMIEGMVGDTLRVTLTNNLPEGTTIHWHGLEVPNDQDGVPGITQPIIEPGQSYTYEFELEKAGTTMYHTHANSVRQLARGLVGPLIVRERSAAARAKYDHDYTKVLHEIGGVFTINGHSFPATLDDPDSVIAMETGDRVRVRFINAGQVHHPMHLHGHQFKVIALDSNDLENPYLANTVDVAPGQTVDVEIVGNNPGTWTFHCHVLPHVTNHGEYPGGMLTVVDYTDHTSFLEGAPAPEQPPAVGAAIATAPAEGTPTPQATAGATAAATAAASGDVVSVVATDFAFDPIDITLPAGEEVTLRLNNAGATFHNFEIADVVLVEADTGEVSEVTFTVPDEPGEELRFICNIPGHADLGMAGVVRIE